MYRIVSIIFFILLGFSLSLKAQTKFSKYYDNNTYGNRISDQGKDFTILNDSGYLFPSLSINLYEVDTLGYAVTYLQVIKTNKYGDTLFRKLYRRKNHTLSVKLISETNDGNYLLVGHTFDLVKYDKDSTGAEVLLVKINTNGDTLWTKTVGIGDGDELVTSVIKTRDGGFAIFGQTCDKKETNCDFYLMKVDSNGNKLWHKTYSWSSNTWEMPETMIETKDGGFLLGGHSADAYIAYLFKTDSVGNKQWSKHLNKFNGYASRTINNICIGQNNTYLISGAATNAVGGSSFGVGYYTRVDSNGEIIMNQLIGNPARSTFLLNIIELNNIVYVQGETRDYLPMGQETNHHILLYAYTSSGIPLWRRTYPDSLVKNKLYRIYRMKITPDNGFAMIGFGRNPITPDSLSSQDVWLLKVDSNGCLYQPCLDMTVGVEANKWNNSTIKIYPNPTDGIITIETEEGIEKTIIYNLLGQTVLSYNSLSEKQIDISTLEQGIYLIKFITKEGLEFLEKVVKK